MSKLGKIKILAVIIIIATVFLAGCTFSYTMSPQEAERYFGPGSEFYEAFGEGGTMDSVFGDGGTFDDIFGRGGVLDRGFYYGGFSFIWKTFGWLIILSIILSLISLILIIIALVSVVQKNVPSSDKVPWILIIIFGGIIGCIIYFAIGSKHLNEKVSSNNP